jgi:hypothetical protein
MRGVAAIPLLLALAQPRALAAPAPAPDPRDLPPEATFADLVRAARALDESKAGASTSRCLLRVRGTKGARLEGPIDLAQRPLGAPAGDLETRAPKGGAVTLVTRHGATGSDHPSLVLVALTPATKALTQAGLLPVLVRTEKGTWFSALAPSGTFSAGAKAELLTPAGVERLRRQVLPVAKGVVVTAASTVTVAQLAATLAILRDFAGPVVLAMPLPENAPEVTQAAAAVTATREARRQRPRDEAPDICRYGIDDIPPGQKHGDLPRGMDKALGDLQRQVTKDCAGTLGPDDGGVLKVAMRIVRSGRVVKACVQEDPTHDAKLRACVVRVINGRTFPRLSRGDFINFGTTLELAPASLLLRAVCAH